MSNGSSPSADPTPLLGDQVPRSRSRRSPNLSGAAQFLRHATSRSRGLREPSLRVREAAAEQIEVRQSDWAYSKPIVIVDLVWNVAFVIVSFSVLVMSRNERPSMPLRLWILGYVTLCVFHVVCVCKEYNKRFLERSGRGGEVRYERSDSNSSSGSGDVDYVSDGGQGNNDETSVTKYLESANTMFSFMWWVTGFYWISGGGESLTTESPQLYWLCIIFLAFDVFFVVICVAVACVIGIAVCCCLPCIIAILYAVADQVEGATKQDVDRLPKYKFRKIGDIEEQNDEIQGSLGGIMEECDTNPPIEHVLSSEDAECCICLSSYEDGAELRELPCRHHFHSDCIDKWLYINATCPLCKFNISKNDNQSSSEEV